MKVWTTRSLALLTAGVILLPAFCVQAQGQRRITVNEYVNKMKAGWVGQMVGVGWGAPTEFHAQNRMLRQDEVPQWKPEMVNQFNQDDLYVEMTFLRTLELHGLTAHIRQAGIDFANSGYPLWHANRNGRDNLRIGIAPPDSGHPAFNRHADDIDYQIEADFAGLIAPGLPNTVIQLGEVFGRLMNYGDGLYGGQFVGGMYAEAFFETDMNKIIAAGLACIPADSQFAECIRDTVQWHKASPSDWEATWKKINDKYQTNPDYRQFSCNKGNFNIDAKINGAYIVMGLLYGQGDPEKTITISMRCGQDSDCNPSNAAGILFTTIGFEQLPDVYKSAIDPNGTFSHTPYSFPKLIEVCEQLAREAVGRAGGNLGRNENREDILLIPVLTPQPSALEQCWEPGPVANSRFTPYEMAMIEANAKDREEGYDGWVALFDGKSLEGWKVTKENADGWKVEDGVLKGSGGRSHLFYDGKHAPFNNFELRLEVLTQPHTNSGVFIHTEYQEQGWPSKGIECQVNNTYLPDPKKTGSAYNIVNLFGVPAQDGEWWDYHIIVKDNWLTIYVNGQKINEYLQPADQTNNSRLSEGTIALQQHDPGSKVSYRNIRIRKLD